MKRIYTALLLLLPLLACNRHSAKIEGRIESGGGAKLRLEKVSVGKVTRIDSVVLPQSGKFSFRIKNAEPATFYQLTLDSLGSVVLPAHNGERIKLLARANALIESSEISGSDDAAGLLTLQKNKERIGQTVDSLLLLPAGTDEVQKGVRREISRLFIRHKQFNTKFILTHATSPASIYAYYQKFNGQVALFGAMDDRFLLRALADSMRSYFPKSTYTKSLLADLEVLENNARRDAMHRMLADAQVMDKPEVALSDAQGKAHSLSSLKGKVVLLDFWVSTNTLCRMDNRELMTIYKEWHKNGFEVYQISLDEAEQEWLIAQQDLPWISVRCGAERGCTTAQEYAVEKVPTNYLINRKGEIVGKNLYGEELKRKVRALL